MTYYASGDVDGLERAIDGLLSDPEKRYAQAVAAQHRMGPDGLSSYAFARRHVEISQSLVGETRPPAGHRQAAVA